MSFVLPSPELPAVSVDRVRMIRRSMRCFVFGVIGIVPLLGLGTAWLALRLWREVAQETGEPALPAVAKKYSVAACAVAVVMLCYTAGLSMSTKQHLTAEETNLYYNDIGLVVIMGILLAARQGWLFFRQYQRAQPREWNPARHLIYWGASLAYVGLVMSSALIIFIAGFMLLVIGR